jgi:hypothetical protein
VSKLLTDFFKTDATAIQTFEHLMFACLLFIRTPLRILVNISAIGSLKLIFASLISSPVSGGSHQLAFWTPGILPSWASFLKQSRQTLNFR